MSVYYKRYTDIYISKASEGSANATNTVLLNVKDFSYNKSSSITKIGRETLDPSQERTIDPHIATISPVNFTFTTYVLSVLDTNVTTPEEYLWASLVGATSAITSNSTQSAIDFADGNVSELHNLTIWFDQSNKSEGNYRLDNAVVDSADINFDINGIAEIQWSGRALSITADNTPPASTDRRLLTNYIKNRLTTITLNMNSVDYTIALTGGSININNNLQFYGRSSLGETTVPVGHYTKNRDISGNLSFYMKSGANQTVDLYNTLLTNAATSGYESTYLAAITINIGGATNTPRLVFSVPQALLELGRQNFNEVITVDVPFVAKEEVSNYCSVTYLI